MKSQATSATTRIMTVGIGSDADRHLVTRIAELTNGICRMLADSVDLTTCLSEIIGYIDKQYYNGLKIENEECQQTSGKRKCQYRIRQHVHVKKINAKEG